MSKYTAEQVDAVVEQTSGTRKEMLNDYAALLRERESAKAVTDEYSDAFKDVLASLVAAVSLLCRGGRKAAASDKIFRIMADDYEKSIIRGRAALEAVAPMLSKLRKHDFYNAGEMDCPSDIKCSNGELHTLRCRNCGLDNPDGYCSSLNQEKEHPVLASARVPDGWRQTLLECISVLDISTGDTDPNTSDEEMRDEYPEVWVMQKLSELLAAASKPEREE